MEVRRTVPGSQAPGSLYLRIDPETGLLLDASQTCSHFMDGRCWDNLTRTSFYRDLSVPWVFGSGFFQGTVLNPGLVFERTLRTWSGERVIRFAVEGPEVVGEVETLRVRAQEVGAKAGAAPWIDGLFWVARDSPFVVAANATIPWADLGASSRLGVVGVNVTRVAHGRGGLDLDVAASGVGSMPDRADRPVYGGTLGNVPSGYRYWFVGVGGSFGEAVSYASEEGLIESADQIVKMAMRGGGGARSGVGPATVSESFSTVYSVYVDDANGSVVEYAIRRTNETGPAGAVPSASFSHGVEKVWERRSPSVHYGHVWGLAAAARMVEVHFPYANQYVSVGPDRGFSVASDGPPRLVYEFSWLHSMGTPPGESLGGTRESVVVDTAAGYLRFVSGPHEGRDGAPPWRAASTRPSP